MICELVCASGNAHTKGNCTEDLGKNRNLYYSCAEQNSCEMINPSIAHAFTYQFPAFGAYLIKSAAAKRKQFPNHSVLWSLCVLWWHSEKIYLGLTIKHVRREFSYLYYICCIWCIIHEQCQDVVEVYEFGNKKYKCRNGHIESGSVLC